MKNLILLSLLSFTTAYAHVCPELAGEYHCLVRSDRYSRLKITQAETSPGIMTYSFDYLAIPGEPELVPASAHGEPGEMGWYTKCKDGKLLSIPGGWENMLAETYLDKNQAYIRVLNGKIVQRCPKAE